MIRKILRAAGAKIVGPAPSGDRKDPMRAHDGAPTVTDSRGPGGPR
ncbi:hypothetical protein [Isoptericola croceus]|nr:hypothetical protein [Isoptericola croceus]